MPQNRLLIIVMFISTFMCSMNSTILYTNRNTTSVQTAVLHWRNCKHCFN